MISKKMRNKIIAAVLGVSMIGGTVFASTNAGDSLQTWYNNKYITSVGSIVTSIGSYAGGLVGELTSWFTSTTKNTVGNVETAKNTAISTANKNIGDAANQYVTDVNGKWDAINAGMQAQYNGFVSTSNGQIDAAGAQGMIYANGVISQVLKDKETSALGEVTSQIGAQQTTSETALRNVIASAKSDISSKMAQREAAATAAIKTHLDAEIAKDEKAIEDATKLLEAQKIANINQEAASAEKAAIDSLDAIALGINSISESHLAFYSPNYVNLTFKLTNAVNLSDTNSDIKITYGSMVGGVFVPAKTSTGSSYEKSKLWSGYLGIDSVKYSSGVKNITPDYDASYLNAIPAGKIIETNVTVKDQTMLKSLEAGIVAVKIEVINNGVSDIQYVVAQ